MKTGPIAARWLDKGFGIKAITEALLQVLVFDASSC